jgi:hypothetical protein
MSWASKRQTTRPEDLAYSLFGIFKVDLPPLYGEGGAKAFLRLQEEIIKTSTDLSIFAWSATDHDSSSRPGIFAVSPANFSIGRFKVDEKVDVEVFRVTNRGLRVKLPLVMGKTDKECIVVLPNCRHSHGQRSYVGIPLRGFNVYNGAVEWSVMLKQGSSVWFRREQGKKEDLTYPVCEVSKGEIRKAQVLKLYLRMGETRQ